MDGATALAIITENAPNPRKLPRGRPTRKEVIGLSRLKARIEKSLDRNSKKIAASYLKFAQIDPPTTRHAVDKVIPNATVNIHIEGVSDFFSAALESVKMRFEK